jgi:hypothetical protein
VAAKELVLGLCVSESALCLVGCLSGRGERSNKGGRRPTSRMLPTTTFWWSESCTPGASLMLVFLMS